MKATIDGDGTLRVYAENGLESYALDKWSKENLGHQEVEGFKMIIELDPNSVTPDADHGQH